MKEYTFDYFNTFKCKASACKHSCCINWEIDIDDKSITKYKKVKGEFKSTLDSGIDYKNQCFKMLDCGKEKRCAFLNDKNLCEIYINLGKNSLCQICTDHPRFRNYFSDRIEWGVGLSCEESARLICENNGYPKFSVSGKEVKKKLTKFEQKIMKLRQELFHLIFEENPSNFVEKLLDKIEIDKIKFLACDYKKIFLGLEILNESWEKRINSIDVSLELNNEYLSIYAQMLAYFLFRHLSTSFDETDIKSKCMFSVLSVLIISSISKAEGENKEKIIDVAREYSEEIEYSDDNLNKIFDVLDCFTIVL